MVERGYREFIVDLDQCATMDSTFMGTMAGIALRLKELGRGHLRVVHCPPRSHELLTGLGLDQIFAIQSNGSQAPTCKALQPSESVSRAEQKSEQKKDMLDAHEALCEAAPENLLRFKDVLDYLKQDLRHEIAVK